MVATIPTRQLYFFSSSFPIEEEEEERTNLFQQDSIPFQFSSCTPHKQISDISSFSSSSDKYSNIFEIVEERGKRMNRWWLRSQLVNCISSPLFFQKKKKKEQTFPNRIPFISFPTIFELHTMVNRFQIFLPFLPFPIFEIVDCFN